MDKLPPSNGGARPGAGRKPNEQKGLARLVKRTVGLTPDQLAFVRAMAHDRSLTDAEILRAIVADYIALGGGTNRRTSG